MLKDQVQKSLKDAPERGELQLTEMVIELAMEQLVKAFDGRSFSITDLRRIARATEMDMEGKQWKALELAHTTGFDGMKRSTLCDLALTSVRLFEMTKDVWDLLPPSRVRRVLAAQCEDGVQWVVSVKEDIDPEEAAAALRDMYNFEPRTAGDIVRAIDSGTEAIAIQAGRKDQWAEYFEVQKEQPAWPRIG